MLTTLIYRSHIRDDEPVKKIEEMVSIANRRNMQSDVTGIFQIIQRVNANGTTVFLVEQNANQALRIAHRGYVMENGRIVTSDSAENLLKSEDVRSAYLGM